LRFNSKNISEISNCITNDCIEIFGNLAGTDFELPEDDTILSKHVAAVFLSPTDVLLLILENSKIYIKTYIKIVPTCFGLRPSSGGLPG
jgi:hypothetical protein